MFVGSHSDPSSALVLPRRAVVLPPRTQPQICPPNECVPAPGAKSQQPNKPLGMLGLNAALRHLQACNHYTRGGGNGYNRPMRFVHALALCGRLFTGWCVCVCYAVDGCV